MSDDLVKRLRSKIITHTDAAVWMLEAAGRIEELEAKLAKAVEFTEGVIRYAGNSGDDYLAEQARTTLAAVSETHKLKGGNDE